MTLKQIFIWMFAFAILLGWAKSLGITDAALDALPGFCTGFLTGWETLHAEPDPRPLPFNVFVGVAAGSILKLIYLGLLWLAFPISIISVARYFHIRSQGNH